MRGILLYNNVLYITLINIHNGSLIPHFGNKDRSTVHQGSKLGQVSE